MKGGFHAENESRSSFIHKFVQRKMVWPLTFICSAVFIRTETLCVKETCCGFQSLLLFSVKSAEHLVRLKLVLGLCLLLVSSLDFIINTLFVFNFPDWRLWPTDMGEIGGAERNKGLFPPHFHVLVWFFAFCHFHFPVFLLLVSAYSSFMSCGSFCIIASVFILPSLLFLFTFHSFLSALLAVCHLPICPHFTSILLSSFSLPLFSLFLWWVHSREDVPPVFPQCMSAHRTL